MGERIQVTANLENALLRLRRNTKRQRHLWADAICIDQTNDAEKKMQLSLMGKIYA